MYFGTLLRAALPAASSRIRETGKKAFVGKNAARILAARGGEAVSVRVGPCFSRAFRRGNRASPRTPGALRAPTVEKPSGPWRNT